MPIHTTDAPYNPSNYRGITIVSSLGTICTKMINDRLEKFSEKLMIVKNNQGGLRNGCSTADPIFSPQSLIDIFLK